MNIQNLKDYISESSGKLSLLLDKHKQASFLDLRSIEQVELGHLSNSAHIPHQQLSQRVSELPHKTQPLVIVGEEDIIEEAFEFLISRNYVVELLLKTDDMSAEQWKKLFEDGTATRGKVLNVLWRANQFLIEHIENIESQLGVKNCRVLDIGCGSGREAVFLAQRGWHVTAVDNQQDALNRVRDLAEGNQVSIDVRLGNIMDAGLNFTEDSFELIIMFRFLHRPLFDKIKVWLKKEGYFICETFSIEAAKFGKPRRKSLLLIPGELSEHFSEWSASEEYQRNLSDGRPLIGCIIRNQ